MKILDIFGRSDSKHSLKPLDESELADLEALLFEKNGRFYFAARSAIKTFWPSPRKPSANFGFFA